MACRSPSVTAFPSHTYIFHTPPAFLRLEAKRADTGVENRKERKVGERSGGEKEFGPRDDEGR